jgi:hypothetical protein
MPTLKPTAIYITRESIDAALHLSKTVPQGLSTRKRRNDVKLKWKKRTQQSII